MEELVVDGLVGHVGTFGAGTNLAHGEQDAGGYA